jgi:hypothetical protein|tara:strand:- start:4027 stop:5025 length:999 start_codon:yes stop_codon:yes gene_type:complete
MANVTIASNSKEFSGKWVPYNYEPFLLGRTGLTDSTDSQAYITQTTGSSGIRITGVCTSEANCNYYYEIHFTNTASTDWFQVKKFTLDGTEIDTIFASTFSGDGRYWRAETSPITIDIGLTIRMAHGTSFDNLDVYRINMPTVEQMRRRRIYHGGISTYLRIPYTEGITFSSDIIPRNLLGKNITFTMGLITPTITTDGNTAHLNVAHSNEDTTGNLAISLSLQYNVKPYGAHSDTAGSTGYVPVSDETWQYGSGFVNELDPNQQDDLPLHGHTPANDVAASLTSTGDPQIYGATTSGRAGHAKIKCEFMNGTGSAAVMCHNQFWPVTLTTS